MTSISGTLLARLQTPTPNDDAWGRLIDLFGPAVYGRCRKAGIPAQDVADVGQEVFLDVTRHIAEFRRDRPGDTFRGWLARITQRRIADYWRHRRRIPEGEAAGGSVARDRIGAVPDYRGADGTESTPSEAEDAAEVEYLRRRALELVAARFKEPTWRACCLVVLTRRSVKDVADELGLTENAVRVAKTRVLACLREEFGDLLD